MTLSEFLDMIEAMDKADEEKQFVICKGDKTIELLRLSTEEAESFYPEFFIITFDDNIIVIAEPGTKLWKGSDDPEAPAKKIIQRRFNP